MSNIIREPGKFEGEPEYIPAFWDRALEGFSDEEVYDGETPVSVFRLDASDPPVLEHDADPGDVLCIWEDSQGFVHSRVMATLCEDDGNPLVRAHSEAFRRIEDTGATARSDRKATS